MPPELELQQRTGLEAMLAIMGNRYVTRAILLELDFQTLLGTAITRVVKANQLHKSCQTIGVCTMFMAMFRSG